MQPPHRFRIARAENASLVDEDGRTYVDLFAAHGAVWIGHGNRAVTDALVAQLGRVWITGALETAIHAEARAAVEGFLPASHRVAAFYSTGMEAAEFAIRFARHVTGRTGVVGFERSTHGKSLATASLGWDNGDGSAVPGFHRLPFVASAPEVVILERLEQTLATHTVSAVFVEPVQGAGGGHAASLAFYDALVRLCRAHGTLVVFDEILTGFHRTGRPFFFSALADVPDVVLMGKAMGNGFPVSGVAADRRHAVVPGMLPGSTYAGNPLAAAAVAATLREVRALDVPARVQRIDRTMRDALEKLRPTGAAVRGLGALWVIELPPTVDTEAVVAAIYGAGVAVGSAGRLIRLLPAATIEPVDLARACAVVADVVGKACGERR